MAIDKLVFPADGQGTLYKLDDITGITADGVLYVEDGADILKRVLNGVVRAVECGILPDGTNQTTKINEVLALSYVKELVFDNLEAVAFTISGTVNVPNGKRIVFKNGNYITGAGTWSGGLIVCDVEKKCFNTTVTVQNLVNNGTSVCWYDAPADNATDCLPAFNKALSSMIEMHSSNPTYCSSKGKVFIPAGASKYYLSGQWTIARQVEIAGQGIECTGLRFPSALGVPAMAFNFFTNSGGIVKGGARCYVHDFTIYGNTGEGYNAHENDDASHGIFLNTPLNHFARVGVNYFDGNGWHIEAASPTGNANNNRFYSCEGQWNGNAGLYIVGPDSNNNLFDGCNFTANGKFGIWDKSFLGNTYIAFHTATNGVENPTNKTSVSNGGQEYWCILDHVAAADNEPGVGVNWHTYWYNSRIDTGQHVFYKPWTIGNNYYFGAEYYLNNLNQSGILVGCYEEGGTGYPSGRNESNSMVLSGFTSINNPYGFLTMRGGALNTRDVTATNFTNNVNTILHSSAANMVGFFDADNDVTLSFNYWKGQQAFSFGKNGGDGRVWFFSDETTTAYCGRSAWPSFTQFGVDDGIFLGKGTSGWFRNLSMGPLAPTTGAWGEGDFRINTDVANPDIIGWRCMAAGTPGTWTAVSVAGGGGGGGTPSLNEKQIGFGDATDLLSGDDHFTFDNATKTMTIYNQGDNIAKIVLQSFNATYYTEISNTAAGNGDFILNIAGDSTANQNFKLRINGVDMFIMRGNGQIAFPASSGIVYADNAAALAGGLTAGMFYRTGDGVGMVH
jgi:hypothetical protein